MTEKEALRCQRDIKFFHFCHQVAAKLASNAQSGELSEFRRRACSGVHQFPQVLQFLVWDVDGGCCSRHPRADRVDAAAGFHQYGGHVPGARHQRELDRSAHALVVSRVVLRLARAERRVGRHDAGQLDVAVSVEEVPHHVDAVE